ncbi:hypothetical protein B0H66DRAFT_629730 [Apodospora peruviana]|uniref:Ricin B lectin domain-containing protein n=1 Tax=Apodospora peruviana TaxID=516989 RepID=A0AAE0HVN6_9PEZI|nr:hypothetical protein B0H66DRAFT_629730 [Apodospora peruviana]
MALKFSLSVLLVLATATGATPILQPRVVDSLNPEAFAEAQKEDKTATKAFSNVQIKTSDGKCLFVDKLSGDFRANLTPVQVGTCGSTDGQGWDIITSGAHINGQNVMLIVSTLTQACFNFDDRRAAGNQVLLFSCGGRADGGGEVTNSQIFEFDGGAGPLSLKPQNAEGSCLAVKGNAIDIASCNGDASQTFTFGGAGGNKQGTGNDNVGDGQDEPSGARSSDSKTTSCTKRTRTVTASSKNGDPTPSVNLGAEVPKTTAAPPQTTVAAGNGNNNNNGNGGILAANPTEPVPVSGARSVLDPTAAAQSHQKDEGATRAFTGVQIRDPNGQCLFIDPTAGDFRQNLIPVSTVDCTGAANEKFDIITSGKHNNKANSALIVSSLTNGCISFDGRRKAGDTVNIFSCGGRADGEGETDGNQLFPFIGQTSFALAPSNERGAACLLPGDQGRIISGDCPTDGSQLFSIFP